MIKNTPLVESTDLFLYEIGHLLVIQLLPNATIEKKIKEQWFNDEGISLSLLALEESGYITHIKSKKNPWQSVRLSRKGKDFVKGLYATPVSQLAHDCLEVLIRYYNEYEIKDKIKNSKKTLFYINEWLNYKKQEQGIDYTLRQFEAVLYSYLESFPFNRKIYIKNSLALFFHSDNAFATQWYPESCPFEEYIHLNKEDIIIKYNKL